MLRAVGLVAQWDAMVAELPAGWPEMASLVLRPKDAPRAATLLGSLSPGVAGDELHLRVTSQGGGPRRRTAAARPARRGGHPRHAGARGRGGRGAAAESAEHSSTPLAAAWDELAAGLPEDWSDVLCLVELRSSDELDPAALALAPVNPSRHEGTLGFRFRVARRFGYGAAPGMARRCLERVDEAGIPGRLRLLEAFSDTKPVLTQGPTFVVSDRAV